MANEYDIDFQNTGRGWLGSSCGALETLIDGITDDGPYGPVEVTYEGDEGEVHTVTGVLHSRWQGRVVIGTLMLDPDSIRRFRA